MKSIFIHEEFNLQENKISIITKKAFLLISSTNKHVDYYAVSFRGILLH